MGILRRMLGLDWDLPPGERRKIIAASVTTIATAAALLTLADPFGWLGSTISEEHHDAWTIGIFAVVILVVLVVGYSRAAHIVAEREKETRARFSSAVQVSDTALADEHVLNLLSHPASGLRVDALGAGLGEFWNLTRSHLLDLPDSSQVRILLLDPSFPDPREGKSLASVRERTNGAPDRQIRRDVLHWRKWLQEHPDAPSRLEARLYRATPTMAMIRIDNDLTFTPYFLPTGGTRTPVFRLVKQDTSDATTGRLYETLLGNFDTLWEAPTSRPLNEVPAWELDAWESNILFPVSS